MPDLDGLGLLAPGLAQVGVQVDQPRADQATTGIEDGGAGGRVDALGQAGDGGAGDRDVEAGQALGSDDGAAPNDEGHVRQRRRPPRLRRR